MPENACYVQVGRQPVYQHVNACFDPSKKSDCTGVDAKWDETIGACTTDMHVAMVRTLPDPVSGVARRIARVTSANEDAIPSHILPCTDFSARDYMSHRNILNACNLKLREAHGYYDGTQYVEKDVCFSLRYDGAHSDPISATLGPHDPHAPACSQELLRALGYDIKMYTSCNETPKCPT